VLKDVWSFEVGCSELNRKERGFVSKKRRLVGENGIV